MKSFDMQYHTLDDKNGQTTRIFVDDTKGLNRSFRLTNCLNNSWQTLPQKDLLISAASFIYYKLPCTIEYYNIDIDIPLNISQSLQE